MANGWTSERRARQAKLIKRWRPWEKSTGPRSAEGKRRTSQNGFKGADWRKTGDLLSAMNELLREQRDDLKLMKS